MSSDILSNPHVAHRYIRAFRRGSTITRDITRVSNRNFVAHCVAERNAIFTAISARFVAHIPLPLAPNLRLKVSFLAHQQYGILGAIKVYFSHKFYILLTI